MNYSDYVYFEITDGPDLVRLVPQVLLFPDAKTDWDRNWIQTEVTVKAGVFSGQFVAELMTTDFEFLKRQFIVVDNDLTETVSFEPAEKQFILKIKGDGLGHFQVDCKLTPESHSRESLLFSLHFDQTQIKYFIDQLDRITKAFPIDGNLSIRNE